MNLVTLAPLVLELIEKIAKLYADAKSGAITPDQAVAQIGTLHAQLLATYAVDDQALGERFPKP